MCLCVCVSACAHVCARASHEDTRPRRACCVCLTRGERCAVHVVPCGELCAGESSPAQTSLSAAGLTKRALVSRQRTANHGVNDRRGDGRTMGALQTWGSGLAGWCGGETWGWVEPAGWVEVVVVFVV